MQTMKVAALAVAVVVTIPACAQNPRAGQAAAPPAVMAALIADVEQLEEKMIGLAEAMPESSYGWRPAEGVRSVGEVVLHVAADNYLIPAFTGAQPPASTGIVASNYQTVQAYEARQLDKAASIAEMRASFEHLKRVMSGVTESALATELEFFGNRMTGVELWVLTTTHLHEHLGQNIAYARSNGVVPPWSRGSN